RDGISGYGRGILIGRASLSISFPAGRDFRGPKTALFLLSVFWGFSGKRDARFFRAQLSGGLGRGRESELRLLDGQPGRRFAAGGFRTGLRLSPGGAASAAAGSFVFRPPSIRGSLWSGRRSWRSPGKRRPGRSNK